MNRRRKSTRNLKPLTGGDMVSYYCQREFSECKYLFEQALKLYGDREYDEEVKAILILIRNRTDGICELSCWLSEEECSNWHDKCAHLCASLDELTKY